MLRTTWKYKLLLFVLFMVAYSVFYVLPNFRPVSHPIYLPLTPVDTFFPLIPWTFLIYCSDYLLVGAVICLLDDEAFHSFARAMFITLFICGMFFFLMPTIYPRPVYPHVPNPLVAWMMNLVSKADQPTNCFPSMHIALTGVATWSLRHKGRKVFLFFVFWSAAIYLSTLTTKQHYLADILGGMAVIAAATVIEKVFSESRLFKAWLARMSS